MGKLSLPSSNGARPRNLIQRPFCTPWIRGAKVRRCASDHGHSLDRSNMEPLGADPLRTRLHSYRMYRQPDPDRIRVTAKANQDIPRATHGSGSGRAHRDHPVFALPTANPANQGTGLRRGRTSPPTEALAGYQTSIIPAALAGGSDRCLDRITQHSNMNRRFFQFSSSSSPQANSYPRQHRSELQVRCQILRFARVTPGCLTMR